MKKIITTIAIILTVGFLGAQVASAHGHGHRGGGYGPMYRAYCNTVNSTMGYGMMGNGMMRHGMPGHGPWSCWATRGPAN